MTNFKNDDDDEQELLRDGEKIRVPLLMMDALQRDVRNHFQMRTLDAASHRPGYRYPARATKDQLAEANENWREPGAVELLVRDAGVDFAREQLADAYAAYNADVTTRWQNAAPIPVIESEDADPTSIGAAGSIGTADAREQAYLEYDRRTRDAWRGDRNV